MARFLGTRRLEGKACNGAAPRPPIDGGLDSNFLGKFQPMKLKDAGLLKG
jgi:hypothetical protein